MDSSFTKIGMKLINRIFGINTQPVAMPSQSVEKVELGAHRAFGFDEIIGQEEAKEALMDMIAAAVKTDKALDHLLFTGPAGTGKTSLANVVAFELGRGFESIMADKIEHWDDLIGIITDLNPGDVFFIDEIHMLGDKMQTKLYDVLEDGVTDFFNPVTNTWSKVQLPKFTLIGGTTDPGLLNPALKRRFEEKRLVPYTRDEMKRIAISKARKMYSIELPDGIAGRIGDLSLVYGPFKAVKILKALMVSAESASNGTIAAEHLTNDVLDRSLRIRGIDPVVGLDVDCRRYLMALSSEACIGLGGLKTKLNERKASTVEAIEVLVSTEVSMPTFVVRDGRFVQVGIWNGPMIEFTSRGRTITEGGRKYLEMCAVLQASPAGWFRSERLS